MTKITREVYSVSRQAHPFMAVAWMLNKADYRPVFVNSRGGNAEFVERGKSFATEQECHEWITEKYKVSKVTIEIG